MRSRWCAHRSYAKARTNQLRSALCLPERLATAGCTKQSFEEEIDSRFFLPSMDPFFHQPFRSGRALFDCDATGCQAPREARGKETGSDQLVARVNWVSERRCTVAAYIRIVSTACVSECATSSEVHQQPWRLIAFACRAARMFQNERSAHPPTEDKPLSKPNKTVTKP